MTDASTTAVTFGPRDRQGPKSPSTMTLPRSPNSWRRTSTLDATFPYGASGPTRFILRARDLHTGADGRTAVAGEANVIADIDLLSGVRTIEATPADARLERLIGENPFVRWGAAVDAVLPDERDGATLLYNVLDALAGWSRLAGYGVRALPPGTDNAVDLTRPPRELPIGNCAGWRDDATIPLLHRSGQSAAEFIRPVAPDLNRVDDSQAWHATDVLAPASMRRRRRIDISTGDDGATMHLDAMFRDTHFEPDGTETVLHEYTLVGAIDRVSLRVLRIEATPRSLPYQECPWATGSVQTLVGHDVRSMRSFVRKEMRGTSTCTHLNEFLRTFADLGAMVSVLHS